MCPYFHNIAVVVIDTLLLFTFICSFIFHSLCCRLEICHFVLVILYCSYSYNMLSQYKYVEKLQFVLHQGIMLRVLFIFFRHLLCHRLNSTQINGEFSHLPWNVSKFTLLLCGAYCNIKKLQCLIQQFTIKYTRFTICLIAFTYDKMNENDAYLIFCTIPNALRHLLPVNSSSNWNCLNPNWKQCTPSGISE